MRFVFLCSILAAILISSCDMQMLVAPEQDRFRVRTLRNAHKSCENCHTTNKPVHGDALFAPGADPSASCLACHDYKENHHPVDFTPRNGAGIPFPLFEGKVTCLTCHEIHGGPGNKGTDKLLHGGPYGDRQQICFRCHAHEQYALINPHLMLDNDHTFREVNGKPVCLLCHAEIPDPSRDGTNDVKFRADVGFLCWRCHPPMPDPFFKVHFLVKPSATVLENMHSSEEKLRVTMPIVPRGRITCSTCHNPHQKGVIQRESAAKGADVKNKLRLPSVCYPCHLI
jgi:predicted CXXCH cytochrome family protein